jgi:hypothetical protein
MDFDRKHSMGGSIRFLQNMLAEIKRGEPDLLEQIRHPHVIDKMERVIAFIEKEFYDIIVREEGVDPRQGVKKG